MPANRLDALTDQSSDAAMRLNSLERVFLLWGCVMLIGGSVMIFHSTDMIMFHAGAKRMDVVSTAKCQLYGGIAMVLGVGICWMATAGKRN